MVLRFKHFFEFSFQSYDPKTKTPTFPKSLQMTWYFYTPLRMVNILCVWCLIHNNSFIFWRFLNDLQSFGIFKFVFFVSNVSCSYFFVLSLREYLAITPAKHYSDRNVHTLLLKFKMHTNFKHFRFVFFVLSIIELDSYHIIMYRLCFVHKIVGNILSCS